MDSTETPRELERSDPGLPRSFEFIPDRPENLVDPWWMGRAFEAGYHEFLYRRWPIDLDEIDPSVLDARFPTDVRLVRRAAFLNSRKLEAVLEVDGALALLELHQDSLWVGVAGRDQVAARELLEAIATVFPHAEPEKRGPSIMLGIWTAANGGNRRFHTRGVQPWQELPTATLRLPARPLTASFGDSSQAPGAS